MEKISNILSSLIIVATPLTFVKIILKSNIRKNKLRIVIAILTAVILNILIYKYTEGIYRSIFGTIICVFVVHNIYKISLNKSIFSVIISMLLLIIPDFLFLYSTIYIFGFSKEYCYTVLADSLLSNFVVYILMIPITLILKKPLRKLLDIKLDYNKKVIIISVLTLISILVFFFDIVASVRIGAKIILYIIAIITFASILIYMIYQENKNTQLELEHETLLEVTQVYEAQLEKEKISKHEYKNELITIRSKIIDNDKKEKIVSYINELLGDEEEYEITGSTNFQHLPPNGLKTFFYLKTSIAKSKGIQIKINIVPTIKDSILKDLNAKEFKALGILLGVYLDNAIDASEMSEKKLLGIEMYNTDDEVTIIISNSYAVRIDTNKVGNVHYSTKGKDRGYGLLLVNKTLRKNEKFITEREITKNLYIQTIILKK